MADDKTFPCCKDLFRLSECIRVPTNRLQHWSIRKQPPCLSAKTGSETRTYVPSSFRVQNIRARQSFARKWHTAISRKVVGKSARDNLERYCGWFWVYCSSKKFERMAREAMDVCLHVLKESKKRCVDSYSVWNGVLIISRISFRERRVHIFADNLSRNSCVQKV